MPTPKMAAHRRLALWLIAGSLVIVMTRAVKLGITGDRVYMFLALVTIGWILSYDDRPRRK